MSIGQDSLAHSAIYRCSMHGISFIAYIKVFLCIFGPPIGSRDLMHICTLLMSSNSESGFPAIMRVACATGADLELVDIGYSN